MENRLGTTHATGRRAARSQKLGAVHLLLHGVWAFKVSAEGERTDLVLEDRLAITADIEATAEAIVLTEWKRATDGADAARKAVLARDQASRYAGGALAATELRHTRYIVLVTKD